MSRISVLTPVDPNRAQFLGETGRSISAQALPRGWEIEWCIQVDGASPDADLPALPDTIPTEVVANGARFGEIVTRNLALARATGDWVVPVDADDLLAAGGLAACIDAVERWPEARYVAAPYVDLLPDGELRSFPLPYDEGWLEPGTVTWRDGWPWVGAGGFLAADVLRAVGGYAGIPRCGDIAPWCVIAACFGGVYIHTVLGQYRKWPGENTASSSWPALRPLACLATSQVDALLRIGGLPPPRRGRAT